MTDRPRGGTTTEDDSRPVQGERPDREAPTSDGGPGPFDLVLLMLRNGSLVLGLPVLLMVLVAVVTLLLGREYTATGSFAPQAASSSLARFAGVAAQLGVAIPTSQANESPDFYADLLRSRHLLGELVESRYAMPGGSDSVTGRLVDLYGFKSGDSASREDKAIRRLDRHLSVSVASKTGVVTFQVTTWSPQLSKEVADRALEVLNQFNLERRQSRAGAERRFVEQRLHDAQGDLREAEDRLQGWLQENRDYKSSPRLVFEFQRLQNEVTLKETLVNTLAQSFEQARIDEVRDTPVLTVVEDPVIPTRPDSRHLIAKAVLSLLLGFGLGAILAMSRESWRRLRVERGGDVAEARRLLRELTFRG